MRNPEENLQTYAVNCRQDIQIGVRDQLTDLHLPVFLQGQATGGFLLDDYHFACGGSAHVLRHTLQGSLCIKPAHIVGTS